MSSSDEDSKKSSNESFDRSSDESSDFERDCINWDPDKAVFTFPRMPSEKNGKKKRGNSLPPLRRSSLSSGDSDSMEEQSSILSRKRKRDTNTKSPPPVEYPRLPPSPTYRSSKSQPVSPKPAEEDSFHDLVEENNELRARIQVSEYIENQFIEAASSIGEVAFSSPFEECNIEPVQRTLSNINHPAAEGCLALFEKLAETRDHFTQARIREAEQLIRIEELDEASHQLEILQKKIELLEGENNELKKDLADSNWRSLNKPTKFKEKAQIKTLVGVNRRFKEIQRKDRTTISKLRSDVEGLKNDNHHIEKQKIQLKESAQSYLTVLERFYEKLRNEKSTNGLDSDPTGATERPEKYNAENKKAAAALERVMDMLNNKDFVDTFGSLSAENPYDFPTFSSFSTSIMVFAAGDLTPDARLAEVKEEELETPSVAIGLRDIQADDPCRVPKEALAKIQKEWSAYTEAMNKKYEAKKREYEKKATSDGEILKGANLIMSGDMMVIQKEVKRLEGEVKDLRSCDDVRAELQRAEQKNRDLEKKLSEHAANPPTGEQAPAENIKKLQDKITELEAQIRVLHSCDDISEQLKRAKKEKSDLEDKLELAQNTPADGDYQARVDRALEKQRIRYVRRINILHRRKQQEMFSTNNRIGKPRNTTLADLLIQDGPPIKEYSDAWFATQWEALYDRVAILCNINYCGRDGHVDFLYNDNANQDRLLSYYLRDVVLSERSMRNRINEITTTSGQSYRARVATAVFFRILIEEIFNPIRFLVNLQFQEPTQTWRKKEQFRRAFETFGRPMAEYRPSFQDKSSWYTASLENRDGFERHARKRAANSFNYIREMEDKNYGEDNDTDALLFNTVRAKMILAMFQSVDDEILHVKFQELRSDISMLIRDTLAPIRLPRGQAGPGQLEAWDGKSLKFAVEEILKFTFNLAVTMRSQRRIIYVDLEGLELMAMLPFKADTMTDAEQPENPTRAQRDQHDNGIQARADTFEAARMNPMGKVEVVVQPALWRKGGERGGFSAANIHVISKSKVITRVVEPPPEPGVTK